MKQVSDVTARIVAATVVGLVVCSGITYAAGPALGLNPAALGAPSRRDPGIHLQSVLPGAAPLQAVSPQRETATPEEVIGRLAYKISYVGSVLLTADRIVRSVDSVLDSMEWTGNDGTTLRIAAEPASRGFEVGIRLSRPLDF
jgi:hypothetical protein